MNAADLGPGEAAARAQRRRTLAIYGVVVAICAALGMTVALVEPRKASLWTGGTLPPWLAMLVALLLVVALGYGSWRYYRNIDELQRLDTYHAGFVGANVVLGGYPVWLILWKGGVVPPPSAFGLFLASWSATALVLAWRKLR